jgi:hypothetical protein
MEIYDYLDANDIPYERHDHPPVFTCEDVDRLVPALPGQKTKEPVPLRQQGQTALSRHPAR